MLFPMCFSFLYMVGKCWNKRTRTRKELLGHSFIHPFSKYLLNILSEPKVDLGFSSEQSRQNPAPTESSSSREGVSGGSNKLINE